jgi:hypothetical protein
MGGNDSKMLRVAICSTSKFARVALDAILKLKKPSIDTKLFGDEDSALRYALLLS